MAHHLAQRRHQRGIYAKSEHRVGEALHAQHLRYSYPLLTNISRPQDRRWLRYFLDPYSGDSTSKNQPIEASYWSLVFQRDYFRVVY